MLKKAIGVALGVGFYSVSAIAEQLPEKFIGSWGGENEFADKLQEPCSKSNYDTLIRSDSTVDANNERCRILSVKSGAEYVSSTVSVDQFCENDHYGNYRKTELWTVFDIGKERYMISVATRYPDKLMGKKTAGNLQGSLLKLCR